MLTIREVRRPHKLIDYLRAKRKLNSDSHLARLLKVPTPTIHRIRHGKCAISGDVILAIYDVKSFELSIDQIRDLINEQRAAEQQNL